MRYQVLTAVLVASGTSMDGAAQDYYWTGSASNLWDNPDNWQDQLGGTPQGAPGCHPDFLGVNVALERGRGPIEMGDCGVALLGNVECMLPLIVGGHLTVQTASFQELSLFNGTLNAMSPTTIAGTLTLNNGTLHGPALISLVGDTTIAVASNFDGPIVNNGAVAQLHAAHLRAGSEVRNQSTWVSSGSTGRVMQGPGTFRNEGVLLSDLSGTSAVFDITAILDNVGGDIAVLDGAMAVKGGGTWSGGTLLVEPGAIVSVFGGSGDGGLESPLTVRVTGELQAQGDGRIAVVDWFNIFGGTLETSLTNGTDTGFWIRTGGAAVNLEGLSSEIVNHGHMTWSSGAIQGDGGVVNRGTLMIERYDGAAGVSLAGPFVENEAGGTIEIRQGLELAAGRIRCEAGSTFTLAEGDITSGDGPGGHIELHDTTFTAEGVHVITVPLHQTGGSIRVHDLLSLLGGGVHSTTVYYTSGGELELADARIEVDGVATVAGDGVVTLDTDGELCLSGVFTNSCSFNMRGGLIEGPALFQNRGRFTWERGEIRENGIRHSGEAFSIVGAGKTLSGLLWVAGGATVSHAASTPTLTTSGLISIDRGGTYELLGTSSIGGVGMLENEGLVHSTEGFHQVGPTLDNRGIVDTSGGSIHFLGPTIQWDGGTLSGGTWRVCKELRLIPNTPMTRNQGAIELTCPSADFRNLRSTTDPFVNDGLLRLRNGADHTTAGPVMNNGTLSVEPASSLTCSTFDNRAFARIDGRVVGMVVNRPFGRTTGNGVLGPAASNTGWWQPGDSPGTLTVEGDFAQGFEGRLQIELAGTRPDVDHDQLLVLGEATLAGELQVLRLDGYEPSPGTVFTIIDQATAIVGEFDYVIGNAFVEVTYGTNSVSIAYLGPRSPADVDGDGDVDVADLLIVLQGWGACEPGHCAGDVNADGAVATSDLLAILAAWTT